MPPSPLEFLQHIQAKLAYILKYSQGVTYIDIDIIIEQELNKS